MKNVAILVIVIASSIAAIGFNLANAIPQQCLLKDEKAALDTFMSDWRNYVYTQLPIDVQDPIFNTYKEISKLPICENMKGYVKKPLLVDTYTGSMAAKSPDLKKMENVYKEEGFGSRILREWLFTNYVLPFPEELRKTITENIPLPKPTNSTEKIETFCKNLTADECYKKWRTPAIQKNIPSVVAFILAIDDSEAKNKSYYNTTGYGGGSIITDKEKEKKIVVTWVGCTKKQLIQPAFQIVSDLEVKLHELRGILPTLYCTFDQFTLIKSKDPNSISIKYYETRPDIATRSVNIVKAQQVGATDIFNVALKICAGSMKAEGQTITLSSDKEAKDLEINVRIEAGSCYSESINIHAEDPDSISATFKQPGSDSKESLKAEIEALEKQLNKPSIPNWIKNNAKWWSDKQIGDADFVQGIQYLITQEIIKIPETKAGSGTSQEIPAWIRNNAKWWADGQISDDDFISGIQYLISNGIMKV